MDEVQQEIQRRTSAVEKLREEEAEYKSLASITSEQAETLNDELGC